MDLKKERAELLAKARGIIDAAKAAGREVTPSEAQEVQAAITRLGEINAELAKAPEMDPAIRAFMEAPIGTGGVAVGKGRGLDFTDQQKADFGRALRTKGAWRADNLRMKAGETFVGPLSMRTDTGQVAQARAAGSMGNLRALLTPATADSGTVRWYTMSNGTADIVPEGGEKPDAGITTEPKEASLSKIATTFGVSDEFSEDAPMLLSSIGEQAVDAVIARENKLILDTFDSTSGVVAADATAATLVDDLADAIATAEAYNGVTPLYAVLNPVDLATLRKAKGSGSGDYALDPTAPGPRTIHGVGLMPVPAVTAGEIWLVSQDAGLFFDRSGMRLESGFTGDDFTHNIVRVRVEERVLPAITRPSRITKITVAPAA